MTRFSETEKWRDPWFRSLKPSHKLLFLFVVDNCNNAGFWEEDKDYACYATGISSEEYEGAREGLARGLVGAAGWLWVRRFLKHQKNANLNPENNAHIQIIALISEQVNRFSGIAEFDQFLAPNEGLISPIGKGRGKCIGQKDGEVQERKGTKAGFEEFWSAYPKKKAKGDAEKAWLTMKGSEHLESILLGITASRKSEQWLKDGGKFIPHPATWLRSRSWEDNHKITKAATATPRQDVPINLAEIGPMPGFLEGLRKMNGHGTDEYEEVSL